MKNFIKIFKQYRNQKSFLIYKNQDITSLIWSIKKMKIKEVDISELKELKEEKNVNTLITIKIIKNY